MEHLLCRHCQLALTSPAGRGLHCGLRQRSFLSRFFSRLKRWRTIAKKRPAAHPQETTETAATLEAVVPRTASVAQVIHFIEKDQASPSTRTSERQELAPDSIPATSHCSELPAECGNNIFTTKLVKDPDNAQVSAKLGANEELPDTERQDYTDSIPTLNAGQSSYADSAPTLNAEQRDYAASIPTLDVDFARRGLIRRLYQMPEPTSAR